MDNSQTINSLPVLPPPIADATGDSWSLPHDTPQAEFSYFGVGSAEVLPVLSLPIADTISAEPEQPTKKGHDSEELLLLAERWDSCKALLLQIWDALPAVPSVPSRREWAIAHGVPPKDVLQWFRHRKERRKKRGMEVHPDDGYELQIEQSSEPLPTSSGGELGLTKIVPIASAPKAKPDRKRKATIDEIGVPAIEAAKTTTKSTSKQHKRPKVETMSTVNALASTSAITGGTSVFKDPGEGPTSFGPKAPTSHTAPPHSFAAKTYTSTLTAPFVLENAQENAPNLPKPFLSSSLAFVKEFPVTEPSPYATRPLPPLPTFEALRDPVAFVKDCKDVLRTALEINYGLGLWDPVVEALPPSYFMDLGKDIDFEWPEIDWP
ncbi:hypothetical protein FRC08_000817 [Ceratobasidium sp. 394]|nr:hypothetical protein FRC08_000817 [Ceratobasidium sp. 394]